MEGLLRDDYTNAGTLDARLTLAMQSGEFE